MAPIQDELLPDAAELPKKVQIAPPRVLNDYFGRYTTPVAHCITLYFFSLKAPGIWSLH